MSRQTSALLLCVAAIASTGCDRLGADARRADSGAVPVPRPELLELRRVWAGPAPNFYPSTPSPDGRLISEIDWSTGDLAVIELESGRLRRVTNKGSWSQSGDYAEFSVFSPDGQRIAYSWFSKDAGGYQIRESRLDGTATRVVFARRPENRYVAVEDWSRDGASILVTVFRTDRTIQVGIVNAADGAYRALETHGWQPPSVVTFSPDGRFIAFDLGKTGTPTEREIFVLATDGSRKASVVSEGDNRLLGWLPDGRGLLYHRRGKDSRHVMAIGIDDGRPVGRPQLVRRDVMHLESLGFSRDAFFYGLNTELPLVHVVDVDLAAGRTLTEPAPLADPDDGAGHDAAWSPDGQMIAYLVDAPGGARLVVRNLAGQLQRQMLISLSQARKTRWTPDGSALLVYGTDLEGRVGIHRVDLRSGVQKPLLAGSPGGETEGMAFWALSPDGTTIYHRAPKGRDQAHLDLTGTDKVTPAGHIIVAHDTKTGRSREVVSNTQGPGRALSVSPDGAWIAFWRANQQTGESGVAIVPVKGGEPRDVYRQKGGRGLGNRGAIEWAPDGSSILIFNAPEEGPGGIWQVPINGGAPRLLLDDRHVTPQMNGVRADPRNFRLSADGRRLVYEAGRIRGEIWMMSGFDAAKR